MITINQVCISCNTNEKIANLWLIHLNNAIHDYDINTPSRQAAFLSQIGFESRGFQSLSEDLNYSASGLLKTFPTHFNKITASQYEKKPESIANHVYALRNGNGSESSGDGWKYRGRGPIQLTGLINYANTRDKLRRIYGSEVPDFVLFPDEIENPKWGAECAAMFWKGNGCNELADIGNIDAITRKINGPAMNGKDKRRALWIKAKNIFGLK